MMHTNKPHDKNSSMSKDLNTHPQTHTSQKTNYNKIKAPHIIVQIEHPVKM